MSPRTFTAEQVDAAVAVLTDDPDRFGHASEIVQHAAPGLQSVLNAALVDGGWFDAAHEEKVAAATNEADAGARAIAVRTLVAEETQLGMLVGVAVGIELMRTLIDLEETP